MNDNESQCESDEPMQIWRPKVGRGTKVLMWLLLVGVLVSFAAIFIVTVGFN